MGSGTVTKKNGAGPRQYQTSPEKLNVTLAWYHHSVSIEQPREQAEQLLLPCPSPCVKRCGIDETLRCSGCLRTGREVAEWLTMSDAERWDLLMVVSQRRR